MRFFRKIIFALAVMAILPKIAIADDEVELVRPVNSSFMLGVGSSHTADTYLSPLKYSGWAVSFQYERLQAMKFSPDGWRQQLILGVEFARTKNPSGNASMLYGNISVSWGMLHLWRLPKGLQLALGGSSGIDAGGLYSQRNSNNPASAKVDWTVNLTGYALWNIKLWRLPVTLRWQSTMPLTGVFFSPEYDELYYEIYLGNRSGLVHAAWPGNFFRWDNLVTADLALSTTRLRLGFKSRLLSTKVNEIVTNVYSFEFVVGLTGDWLSLSPYKTNKSVEARTVWALY